MQKIIILFLILFPIVLGVSRKDVLDFTLNQYKKVSQTLQTGTQYPYHGKPESKTWDVMGPDHFEAGMYPGVLWQLYHYTKEPWCLELAIQATDGMYMDQYIKTTHDIGFMIDNSYGLGYDFTQNFTYFEYIVNAANHLSLRYSEKVGCIRSWDSPAKYKGEFWVIVDNMMNLELLFRAAALTGNKAFFNMAVSHTNKTIENHLRKDSGSWHVVAFNETTGAVVRKFTAQGYSDNSTWARGQGWLINGFMTTYKYTKMSHILEAAKRVADYFIENLPSDGIPLWDFNVPKDKYPYIPRDTSSAAIASSGLFELYIHTKEEKYLTATQKIMGSLFSSEYRADGKPGYKIPALFVNGTTAGPNAAPGKHDLALSFGDYYFVKSIQYLD